MKNSYPIKVKVSKDFLSEFEDAECGRRDDAHRAREHNDVEAILMNDYDCVLDDFIHRWKSQIEVRNDRELHELYYAAASGTIGLRGYTRQANRVLDEIRDAVLNIEGGEKLVRQWPYQSGY